MLSLIELVEERRLSRLELSWIRELTCFLVLSGLGILFHYELSLLLGLLLLMKVKLRRLILIIQCIYFHISHVLWGQSVQFIEKLAYSRSVASEKLLHKICKEFWLGICLVGVRIEHLHRLRNIKKYNSRHQKINII